MGKGDKKNTQRQNSNGARTVKPVRTMLKKLNLPKPQLQKLLQRNNRKPSNKIGWLFY